MLRYGIALAALTLAGLAVWVLSTPAAAGSLFGDAGYEAAYSSPLYGFSGLPLLALPLVAGLLLPRGFFLWGVTTVLPYLPGSIWAYLNAGPEATFLTPDPGIGQILGLAFVEFVIFLALSLVCTFAAGIGLRLRSLWWRLRGESVPRRLGLSQGIGSRG